MVWEEIFPKDLKVAFHPNNCITLGSPDKYSDNLYRFSGSIPVEVKVRGKSENVIETHHYYIFATDMMLYQLSLAEQWFLDGTFAVSPPGFEQLLIIIVYVPSLKIFYPAAYILLSGKPERLYFHAFSTLVTLAAEHNYILKPTLLMMDFEAGMRNAAKMAFKVEDIAISGCYFHFVKCLMKRAQTLGLIKRKTHNKSAFILIGLLKILVHCPAEIHRDFFAEIESIYHPRGENYKKFLTYYKRNWLHKPFLEGLVQSYAYNHNISFLRTNNPCELFNRYLGNNKFF